MVWSRSIYIFPFIFHLSSRDRVIDFIMTFQTYILLTIQVTVGDMPLSRFTFDETNDDDSFGESSSNTTDQDTDDSDGDGEKPDVVDDILFYPLPPLDEIKGFFRRYVQSD